MNARFNIVRFAATGLCTNKTFADGTSARFAYTPDGKPLRTTRASGAWTENAYDASGRLASVSTSDGASGYAFSFDPFGRVSAVADPGAPFGQTFSRDSCGFVTNETWNTRRPSYHSPRTLERSFDANGRLSSWRFGTSTSPSGAPALSFGAAVSFGPDGNVSAVVCTNGAGRVLEAEYGYEDGRFASLDISTDSGGAAFDVERDPHRPQRWTAATVPASRQTMHRTAWTYDALDRPTERTRKMPSETAVSTNSYAYDARGQVTGVVVPESESAYSYDSIGNRISSSDAFGLRAYAANAVNAYVSVSNAASASAVEPEWDEDGNLVSFGAAALGWDARGRLVSVETETPEGQPLEIYLTYDWRDRLVDKLVRRKTGRFSWEEELHEYVWDDWLLLLERVEDAEGNVTDVEYFWGPDISGTLQGAGGVGGLLAVSANGDFYFPFYDNNGNVLGYVDENGGYAALYDYDAFGNEIASSGPLASFFRHRFSTKLLDPDTGLYYYW